MNGRVQLRARVISNREVMPETRLLWLEAPEVTASARPGQFVMVRCGVEHDPLLRRPLGIHRTDNVGNLALLFSEVGRGTRWLGRRSTGDAVDLIGPLGNGFAARPDAKQILLLAGGIGLAPLAFAAETAIRQGKAVRLLMGARSARWLCPMRDLPMELDVVTATDDGSGGRMGLVTQVLGEFAGPADQVFACGPAAMYKAMAGLECLKGKPVQVSLEERMACGVGACYGCTVKTRKGLKQVCHDGPVFELADILW